MLSCSLRSVRVTARKWVKDKFETNLCSVIQNNNCIARESLCDMPYFLNTASLHANWDSDLALLSAFKRRY